MMTEWRHKSGIVDVWHISNFRHALFHAQSLKLRKPLPNRPREPIAMEFQVWLIHVYERGIHNAASFLRLLVALVLPLVGFRLLIVALRPLLKPATSPHFKRVQPAHSFVALVKHGLSLQRLR